MIPPSRVTSATVGAEPPHPFNAFANAANVFYRPRGDEHDLEHAAKRPAPRQNWQLEDVHLPEADAMRNPELTRELRSLRHNMVLDRPYLSQLYEAGINHALKLDIHTEFLKNLFEHLVRMEKVITQADANVTAKSEEHDHQNTVFSQDLNSLRERCGVLLEGLERNDGQVKQVIEDSARRLGSMETRLEELALVCSGLKTDAVLTSLAAKNNVTSADIGVVKQVVTQELCEGMKDFHAIFESNVEAFRNHVTAQFQTQGNNVQGAQQMAAAAMAIAVAAGHSAQTAQSGVPNASGSNSQSAGNGAGGDSHGPPGGDPWASFFGTSGGGRGTGGAGSGGNGGPGGSGPGGDPTDGPMVFDMGPQRPQ